MSNWSLLFIHISCFAIRKEELIKILQMMHLEKGHPFIMIAFPYLFPVSLLCMCVCVCDAFKNTVVGSDPPLVVGCVGICSEDVVEVSWSCI